MDVYHINRRQLDVNETPGGLLQSLVLNEVNVGLNVDR